MRVRPDVEALALELHKIGASADPPKLYPILEKALDRAFMEGVGSGSETEAILRETGAVAELQRHIDEVTETNRQRWTTTPSMAPALPQGDGAGE